MVKGEHRSPITKENRTEVKNRKRNNNDPLSKREVERVLSKVDNLRDYTLLLFGFYSGVRVSELAFDHNSVSWNEGFVNIWDEKKDRYRRVYVPEGVLDALRRYWNERRDRKDPRFFGMSSKTVERVIQGWTGEVLERPKSWHCVRHTYITQSFESSIPISIVIENTGDKPATILQYYTKLSPTYIKEQVNGKLLFNQI